MTEVMRLPLPEPALGCLDLDHNTGHWMEAARGVSAFDSDQMHAYATAAVMAERERCSRIIEAHQVPVGNSAAGEMAAEWAMDALREVRDAIREGA